jgi:membrane protein DedA with SNARE-associated domain
MLSLVAIIGVSSGLGYVLPALIGLESMGVPSPGETALVLAAVLASQGHLNIWLVILIGAGSAIVGDNIGYWLGRELGREVLEAAGPFRKRRVMLIAVGDRFFKRHGAKTVFIGRWIALIRFATAWLAGINRMRFLTFFVWNAAGGITWAVAYGLVGYYGGEAVAHVLERAGIVAAIVLCVALVVGVVVLKRGERAATRRLHAEQERSGSAGGPAGPPAEDEPMRVRNPARPS